MCVTAGSYDTSISRVNSSTIWGKPWAIIKIVSFKEHILKAYALGSCWKGKLSSCRKYNTRIQYTTSHSGNLQVKKNNNQVNPDVGTDDAKKPVKGDVLQCVAFHWVRPSKTQPSVAPRFFFEFIYSSFCSRKKDSWKKWDALERDDLWKMVLSFENMKL